jgi:hypothetical protein
MGLMIVKCAKLDEYNVWLMLKASTTFPTMVEDHIMNPKLMVQPRHLESVTHG